MKLILILFATSLSMFALGQDDVSKNHACDTALTYWAVQTLPEYKGGNEQLLRDLNNTITLEKHLNGICRIDFLINCKGKTSGYRFDSGFDKAFEKHFLKTFSELQNWKAGKHNNEDVDCSYTLVLRIENGMRKMI